MTAGGIEPRAAAMGLPTTQVDGMDVWAVREAAGECRPRPRRWRTEFVEARTYRFVGHSRSDPGKYRPEGELDRWKRARSPCLAAAHLRDGLGVPEDEVQAIAAASRRRSSATEEAALAAPFPEPSGFPNSRPPR